MSAADPTAAMCAYLLTTSVGDATSGRIYRPTLPDIPDLPEPMPFAAVVVRAAGGYFLFGGGNVPLGDPRLDLICYGASELEAGSVAREAVAALRALRRSTWEGTSLHWARIESGPMPLIDQDTHWPCAVLSAQVAHTEPAVA